MAEVWRGGRRRKKRSEVLWKKCWWWGVWGEVRWGLWKKCWWWGGQTAGEKASKTDGGHGMMAMVQDQKGINETLQYHGMLQNIVPSAFGMIILSSKRSYSEKWSEYQDQSFIWWCFEKEPISNISSDCRKMVVQDQNIAQDCTQLIETPGCNQEKRKAKLLLVINSIRTFKPVLLDQNRLSSAICLEYSHFIHGLGHSFKSRQSKQLHCCKTCPVHCAVDISLEN